MYRSNKKKTPTEDFTTEVLAGVLQSDQSILDEFVNEILLIPGIKFQVETQKAIDGSRIDMVFENKDTICFLENKIESTEGFNQLSSYADILLKSKKKTQLRYCTKYYDKKVKKDFSPLDESSFKQFRWADIYTFFNNGKKDSLITYFITFLKDKNMSSIPEFNSNDLDSMIIFSDIIQKMNECFELTKPEFIPLFGVPNERDSSSLKQIPKHGRYALWKENILPKEWSEILISISFNSDSPKLTAHIYLDKKHENYDDFIKLINSDAVLNANNIILNENEFGVAAKFERKLSDFIHMSNQFDEIKKWYTEKMKLLKNFADRNKSLGWDLP